MSTNPTRMINLTVLVALIAGCGSPAPLTPDPNITAAPGSLTAERIVEECAEAMGGIGKIDSLKTMRVVQNWPNQGLIYEIERPNRVRMGDVAVFDGERAAWLVMDADGTPGAELAPEEEWKTFEVDVAWYVPAFFDYPAEYVGTEVLDDVETHILQVALPLGAIVTYNLDAQTHLVVRAASDVTVGDQEYHREVTYSDYRSQDGILYPHVFVYEGLGGDSVLTATMETLEFNIPFEDGHFSIPPLVPPATAVPADESLSEQEIATLNSLEQVDDHPLYTMQYYGAYDQRLSSIQTWGDTHFSVGSPPAWACSLFAALGDVDSTLYGRNFDWEFSPAVLLFTDPPDGYASVSMVDIAYLGFGGPEASRLTDLPLIERRALLDAPSLPFDGMNERGLAIGMAAVSPGHVPPDPKKETVGSLGVIREMLDHASDVDEAVAILQGYNITFSGPPLHYLIADSSGRAMLVEFYQGEVVVIPNETPWHLATNFLRASAGESAEGQCDRYDRINQRLAEADGRVGSQDAMDLLASVSSQELTQWSIVYEMSTGDVHVAMGRQYDSQQTFRLCLTDE